MPFGFIVISAACFIMGLASPLLSVSSRVMVGLGKYEFPAVEVAETMSIPQTVARLGRDGEFLLMLVVLCSCILFPALKLTLLAFQALGKGADKWKRLGKFLERWSFLELLVLAIFLTILKADKHLEVQSGAAVGWLLGTIFTAAVAHWMIEWKSATFRLRPALTVFALLSLPSCSKPTCEHYIKLDNLGGVAVGSSVMWKGAEIGTVTAIGPEDGKLKATLRLYPTFAGAIRDGVVAEVPALALPVVRGRITLAGGDSPSAKPLVSGTEIPVRSVNFISETIGIAKDNYKEGANAVQRSVEMGAEELKQGILRQIDDASNNAADTLDTLSKKLRR